MSAVYRIEGDFAMQSTRCPLRGDSGVDIEKQAGKMLLFRTVVSFIFALAATK